MIQLNRTLLSVLLCLSLAGTGCVSSSQGNRPVQTPANPALKNANAKEVAKYNLIISQSLLSMQKTVAALQKDKAISRDDASAVMIWIERASAASLIVARIQAKPDPWESQASEIFLMLKPELDALHSTERPALSSASNLNSIKDSITGITNQLEHILWRVK
jgi:hypothetical protein